MCNKYMQRKSKFRVEIKKSSYKMSVEITQIFTLIL